jgi:hypothetical protein
MRRYGFAVTLLAAIGLMASSAWALVPDPDHCEVDSAMINACPYDHPPGSDAERYQDVIVTLLTDQDEPVTEYDVMAQMSFEIDWHPDYPGLGGGPQGDCDNCEDLYTAVALAAQPNGFGQVPVRISVTTIGGGDCNPSMTCPVVVKVTLDPEGPIPYWIEILQNSHDIIANGDVRGPDFTAFATAYGQWVGQGIPHEEADFIWATSPVPQTIWGEVTGPDFTSFATHYTDCCGHPKEPNPANCDEFTDPCP